jgi:hypothetical protein
MQGIKNNCDDGSKQDWRRVWPYQQITEIKRYRRTADKE